MKDKRFAICVKLHLNIVNNAKAKLMSTTSGLLRLYELHDFWEKLDDRHRKNIIEKFKENLGFWDYRTLFNGEQSPDITRGAITILDMLLNNDDLELCDIVYNKFCEYSNTNYLIKSWGSGWDNEFARLKEFYKDLMEIREGERHESVKDRWNFYLHLNPAEVFWKDTHFFLSNYAQRVYKNYLKSNCSIDRFYTAFEFEYNNHTSIISSIRKLLDINISFGVGEQYLIYLEKNKKYDECISFANSFKEQGWRNDFEKRIDRCTKKSNKHSSKS